METQKRNSADMTTANTTPSDENCNDQNGFLLLNKYRGALMGFAALWIYVFHEWLPVFDEHHVRFAALEKFIGETGYIGVDIFLFLAGMGAVYSISRTKNTAAFYYRRIKRILIPFLAVAAMECCFFQWTMERFLKTVGGVYFFQLSIYCFLWFVPTIVIFYLLFPWYYKVFSKVPGKAGFTLCALAIWLIATLYVRDNMRIDLFGFTNRIPIFLIGILAGWLAQNRKILFNGLTWVLLTLMLILGLYLAYLSTYKDMYILVPVSNCCIPSILVTVSLSFLFAGFMNLLSKIPCIRFAETILFHVLSFYGMFTFEFYCLQEFLGDNLISKMSDKYSTATINVALLMIVTTAAFILHRVSKFFWMLVDWGIPKVSAFRPQFAKRLTEIKD